MKVGRNDYGLLRARHAGRRSACESTPHPSALNHVGQNAGLLSPNEFNTTPYQGASSACQVGKRARGYCIG